MRMYNMYLICKTYLGMVKGMRAKSRNANGSTVYFMEQWQKNVELLNELAKTPPLKSAVKEMIRSIPIVNQDDDRFDISVNTMRAYNKALDRLIISMQVIVDAYEVLGVKGSYETSSGFDIKLPQFRDIGEFAKCLEDINFIITQCPYLRSDDGQIKYDSIDIGSAWITFLVVGTSAGILLAHLGKLVDMAVKIKSHVITVRMQEEALRSLTLKNETATEIFEAFNKTNKILMDQCIGDLKQELGKLQNGEEEGKAQKSLEKLAYWMDKGLQIYSTLDAPQEIKDLFPAQEDAPILTDNLQKLLETQKGVEQNNG